MGTGQIDVSGANREHGAPGAMPKIHYEPPVYPFHIDFMRHVSNIVYVQWMEVGRCLLMDAIGLPVEKLAEQGYGPVLVETNVSYKKPIVLGDEVRAEVWVAELANASAWMEFRFSKGDGELAAAGRQRGVFVDLATNRPRRLSPEDRARFEAYLIRPAGGETPQ